jgi:arginine utilization protein RocB
MTKDDDLLLQALARLPLIAPDIEWENHVRKRCHSAIARRVSRRARAGRGLPGTGLLDMAAAAALCVYLGAVLTEAMRLGGSL